MVDCWELQSLPESELSLPEEGEPPDMSLGYHGLPCLLQLPTTLTSTLRMSISLLRACNYSHHHFLPSTLGASSCTPCIHSSMSYATVVVLITFVILQGHSWPPGLSSLFHNSICNGSVAFLYSIYRLPLHKLSYQCPIDLAHQAESYIPGIP